MKYQIHNIFTGEPITSKKPRKYVDPNREVKQIMRNRYTYRQMTDPTDRYAAAKDLQDHSRKKMPASMARWTALYGSEWGAISKNARAAVGWRCQECGQQFEPRELHVHHITPISVYVGRGATFIDTHLCHGVETERPYHVEENLEVLCKEHHGDRHGRTFR